MAREHAGTGKNKDKSSQALQQQRRALKASTEGAAVPGAAAAEIHHPSALASPGLIFISGMFPLGLAGVAAPIAEPLAIS